MSQSSPEREEEILRVYRETRSVRQTSIRCQAGHNTVLRVLHAKGVDTAKKTGPTKSPELAQALEEMRVAAERVNEGDDFEEPVEQLWRRAEEQGKRAIRKAVAQTKFSWRAPGPHLLLTFPSDQHIGPGTPVDFEAMRLDAEATRNTPNCYAIALGDGVDNHIKHRAAVLAARSQPDDQYRLFEHYLSIFGDRLILVCRGNHEAWTNQLAGVDLLGRIVRERRIMYAPFEGYMDLSVGTQLYKVGVRHQYMMNSKMNQTHSVKQWLRLGEQEFDLGVIGHHHEHAIENFLYRGKSRWGCRPGSYQITSAYSSQEGYNRSVPTSPTFLLRGDEYSIQGFESVRTVARAMRAVRELGAA